jgi:molecular chaperone GrpE
VGEKNKQQRMHEQRQGQKLRQIRFFEMNAKEQFARWAEMVDNRRGSTNRSGKEMQDEMTGRESSSQGTAEPEIVTGADVETFNEVTPAQAELDQLKGERDQLLDRLARLQAEFDNARKREVKERADARDYTVSNTVEPFLGVMDNFQLALKADGTAEQLRGGVELILKQMEDALKGLNVQAVETVGTQFDPRIHEALGSIETKEFPDHQVLEEIRRGYKIRDKLLRPALVRIAANADQVAD